MKISVSTQDEGNYKSWKKALEQTNVKLFGKTWFIEELSFGILFNVRATIFIDEEGVQVENE